MLRAYIQRLKLLWELDGYGAVFVYREAALLGPAFLEKMIARKGKPIIYQDGEGSPIAVLAAGTHCHDRKLLIETPDAVVVERPRHGDRERFGDSFERMLGTRFALITWTSK